MLGAFIPLYADADAVMEFRKLIAGFVRRFGSRATKRALAQSLAQLAWKRDSCVQPRRLASRSMTRFASLVRAHTIGNWGLRPNWRILHKMLDFRNFDFADIKMKGANGRGKHPGRDLMAP